MIEKKKEEEEERGMKGKKQRRMGGSESRKYLEGKLRTIWFVLGLVRSFVGWVLIKSLDDEKGLTQARQKKQKTNEKRNNRKE